VKSAFLNGDHREEVYVQ
jgi:hypothetical protein